MDLHSWRHWKWLSKLRGANLQDPFSVTRVAQMLAHLQTFEQDFGVRIVQQSLCPRHAENISDRAQAIANTLIESSKDRGSVIGLNAIVAVLREGPLQHTMRTHLAAVCFGSASVQLAMCMRWQGSIWPQPQALDDSFGAGVHQQGHAPRAKVQASVHSLNDIRTGNDGRFEVA